MHKSLVYDYKKEQYQMLNVISQQANILYSSAKNKQS